MPSKKVMMYVAIFFAGVILADKVRTLPLVNKLPTI